MWPAHLVDSAGPTVCPPLQPPGSSGAASQRAVTQLIPREAGRKGPRGATDGLLVHSLADHGPRVQEVDEMVWKKACRIHSECHRSMPLWLATRLHFCASSFFPDPPFFPPGAALPACPCPPWSAALWRGRPARHHQYPPPFPGSSALSGPPPGATATPALCSLRTDVARGGALFPQPSAKRRQSRAETAACLQAPGGLRAPSFGVVHVSCHGSGTGLGRGWWMRRHLLLVFLAACDPAGESPSWRGSGLGRHAPPALLAAAVPRAP